MMLKVFSCCAIMLLSCFSSAYSNNALNEVGQNIGTPHEISIAGSKGNLFAIVQYPQPDSVHSGLKYPLVILCHGFSGQSESPMMDILADDLLADSMAVLRFDFNGHGKSEGKFQDMTVPNEIADLKCVINWAQHQPWVESISLVGHSQGGVVVGMVSGELGDKVIRAEVLMAPAAVLRDDAIRGNTMGAWYDPWNIQGDYVELPGGLKLGKNYINEALTLPIYETSRQYTGPTFIIHGTHDRVVPYTYGERYHHEIQNSELRLVDGDDHMFSQSMKETCALVANWLNSILH